jgi:hypothetical protein
MTEVDLFGGAMACALPGKLDDDFHDASKFRLVPDHQEIYMYASSGATIIVELLAKVRDVADADAAWYHWEQLAAANRAQGGIDRTQVVERTLPPARFAGPNGAAIVAPRSVTHGVQHVAKFNETDRANDVMVVVGVIRLPAPYLTDVLCSVSAPTRIAAGSSDERYVTSPLVPEAAVELHRPVFESIAIRDFGLFVEEDE